jgi:nucleoside-diphosphate-sugar epimerase
MSNIAIDPLTKFRRVNTEGTIKLERQALTAGVRQFIVLSTIDVNENSTAFGNPFTPNDLPSPHDPHSLGKYEAGIGLHSIAQSTGMWIVIIRPNLVHGSKAPGNFRSLT